MENLPTMPSNNNALSPMHKETAFSSIQGFEAAMRMANALCASSMVPKAYQINPDRSNKEQAIGNAIVALELSQRIGASPFAVFQNMHVIQGRPSWSSSFIIAALNTCGRFAPIRFQMDGEGDNYGCTAWTYDKTNKDRLDGPKVTIGMAKAEGWMGKAGSKWKTMPELMLRYRAAAFFGRLYAPDVLMGMHSEEEVRDMPEVAVLGEVPPAKSIPAKPVVATDLNTAIMGDTQNVAPTPTIGGQPSAKTKPDKKTTIDELREDAVQCIVEAGQTVEGWEKRFNRLHPQWSESQCRKAFDAMTVNEGAATA